MYVLSQVKGWFSVWGSFTYPAWSPVTGAGGWGARPPWSCAARKHRTSTPPPRSAGLLRALPARRACPLCPRPPGIRSLPGNTHSALDTYLPRSFCQSYLRLSKHGCTTFYMTVKSLFPPSFLYSVFCIAVGPRFQIIRLVKTVANWLHFPFSCLSST